jgi:hypothetical protein
MKCTVSPGSAVTAFGLKKGSVIFVSDQLGRSKYTTLSAAQLDQVNVAIKKIREIKDPDGIVIPEGHELSQNWACAPTFMQFRRRTV